MLTGENLGRCKQRGLRPRLHRDQHRFQRDHCLAGTDIALQQAQHRRGLGQIALDLPNRTRLRAGQAERQLQLAAQPPVAHQRRTDAGAVRFLDQQQRQAVRQQFVIGQPVTRGGVFAPVRLRQRLVPGGPLELVQQARLDPFGQRLHLRQRQLDQRRQPPLRQPFGQGIDRLHQLPQRQVAAFGDVIGVDDLQRLAELVQPPGDPAGFAQRQLLFRPAAVAPEIGQRADIARTVRRQHPERATPGTAAIFQRGQRDDDVLADAGLVQIADRAALHEAIGQVIGKVLYPRQPQPLQRARKARPHAFQAVGSCEQGIEPVRTHRQRLCQTLPRLARNVPIFDPAHGMRRPPRALCPQPRKRANTRIRRT